MVDKRTIRKILIGFSEGRNPRTTVKGHIYTAFYDPALGVRLEPQGMGKVATSLVDTSTPEYAEYGEIYKLAVEFAKALDAAISLKLGGT